MVNPHGQHLLRDLHSNCVRGARSIVADWTRIQRGPHKYITGIVRNQGQKLISINGMPDHLHILIGLKPAMALADLVREIKADSSNFVNKNKWVHGKFSWQEGYGAFSYGHSQLNTIIRYIQNQEKHHSRRSFKDEYLTLLRKFDIAFDDKYVFKFIE